MAQDVTTSPASAITYANATLNGKGSTFGGETVVSARWRVGVARGVYTENIAIAPAAILDNVNVPYVLGGRSPGTQYFYLLEITWSGAGAKSGAEVDFTTTAQVPLAPAGSLW